MVTESLERFLDRLKELTSQVNYKLMFEWNKNDLITSMYPTPVGVSPIWKISIGIKGHARYDRLLTDFGKVVAKLFVQVVDAVKELPTVSLKF